MPSQADGSAPEARNARSIRGGPAIRSGGNEPPPELRSKLQKRPSQNSTRVKFCGLVKLYVKMIR